MPSKGTVIVGMSGGVDSSVAALLLQREGWKVIGAFMKNWSDADAAACGESCGWEKERQDALRVAATLGIPFLTFDFEQEYRERVVGYMVREYAAGRTPNPDVLCNSLIKFDLFLQAALAQGADMVATGHYARVDRDAEGRATLLAGLDPNKDQSYFLHRLSQEQLSRTLMPIGSLLKPDVRRIAREAGLPTADKKDSQGICFVGKVDLSTFLKERIPQTPGPIVTADGVRLGTHDGLAPYTVGQRHGFGGGGGTAYFVVAKEIAANTLVVAPAEHPSLYAPGARIEDMHWIAGTAPNFPLSCTARIRYRQPLQEATMVANDELRFATAQRAVTPGQFAVLYDGERCLGGGTIAHGIA